MTMTPVRPDEQVHEEPVTDAAEGTSVRSPGFRLALLVALVAVLSPASARSRGCCRPAASTPSASAATRSRSRASARR